MDTQHIPVLRGEVVRIAKPQAGETYIDLTAGFGGHAAAILASIERDGEAWLIDQDSDAIDALETRFKSHNNVRIVHENFARLEWQTLPPADIILLDAGVSSKQLDNPQRGFSFKHDGPLDMRMNNAERVSAYQLVNELSETELADIIYRYGEERLSRRIAKAIIAARSEEKISTTANLVDIIHTAIGNGGKIDSATKTFQALRIAVNDELRALETVIPKAAKHLKPGGRLIIISFHSLEDRIVKDAFRSLTTAEKDPITGHDVSTPLFYLVTKKPITASPEELDTNPRARSAKLRAVEKQKLTQ
ncbi:16S rRNA (cytosine(1402)-N(4))-methyltransferase RsmH [bacterium]|nr:16S rRNA (cytosine(1402)-N(4))-methyltransferase RsmH [bacterium]